MRRTGERSETMNSQIEEYDSGRREEIVKWILDGLDIYKDDIEYVGDWVYISVYLPE